MPKRLLIYPVFIPMLGCPHRCIYCDQRKITGAQTLDVQQQLAKVAQFVANHPDKNKEVAFYGGSFTALPEDYWAELLSKFSSVIDAKTSFRISTHPLYISDEILLSCYQQGIRCIELGVQDFNDTVLSASQRGYTGAQALEAAKLVKNHGFTLGIQLMPGLPNSSAETIKENHQMLRLIKPEYLRIYPLVVIRGTVLADLYERGLYSPLELEEAIQISADYAELAVSEGITIIKHGLPSNLDKNDVLGGAYHPSYGEFVLAELTIRNVIRDLQNGKEIKLDKKQRSLLMGHSAKYRDLLQKRLGICSIDIEADSLLR
ncbi:MAG: radical SAM protein [Candidatus Cloacimonetes bacterium]|nr:radical SAM protein [Candidatus Cloacimonadota bacterium]